MTKSFILATDPRVISFLAAYQDASKISDTLYHYGTDSIAVHLPRDLTEFANAAQGHMGAASGYQVRGIRRVVGNQVVALANIFGSAQSLANFLNSSECNANEVFSVLRTKSGVQRAKRVVKVTMDKRMAKDAIYAIHGESKGYSILKGIRTTFFGGATPVEAAKNAQRMAKLFDETPMAEIELTYGTKATGYDLSVYAA